MRRGGGDMSAWRWSTMWWFMRQKNLFLLLFIPRIWWWCRSFEVYSYPESSSSSSSSCYHHLNSSFEHSLILFLCFSRSFDQFASLLFYFLRLLQIFLSLFFVSFWETSSDDHPHPDVLESPAESIQVKRRLIEINVKRIFYKKKIMISYGWLNRDGWIISLMIIFHSILPLFSLSKRRPSWILLWFIQFWTRIRASFELQLFRTSGSNSGSPQVFHSFSFQTFLLHFSPSLPIYYSIRFQLTNSFPLLLLLLFCSVIIVIIIVPILPLLLFLFHPSQPPPLHHFLSSSSVFEKSPQKGRETSFVSQTVPSSQL